MPSACPCRAAPTPRPPLRWSRTLPGRPPAPHLFPPHLLPAPRSLPLSLPISTDASRRRRIAVGRDTQEQIEDLPELRRVVLILSVQGIMAERPDSPVPTDSLRLRPMHAEPRNAAVRPSLMRASSASCWSVDTLGHLSRYVMSKVVLIRPACHLCLGRAYNRPVFYGQSPTRFRAFSHLYIGGVRLGFLSFG